MKKALLFEKLEKGKVRCAVCSHRCIILPERRGICGVRENHEGELYSLNYGKTVAFHVDPIEKKPLYHFMPGTRTYSFAASGCNFNCLWCQNWEISQISNMDQPVEGLEISPEEHVERALQSRCPSISYTYSEPTIFLEYALDTMKLGKEKGLKNIWVTNGYMTKETLDLIAPYLDAANVDFKGTNHEAYKKCCGGEAEPILETLKYLKKAGIHIEINTLIVPGINDRYEDLVFIAEFISSKLGSEVPWHISRFFPAWKMLDTPVTPMETLEMAKKIGEKVGLKYIHIGNV